MMVLRGTGILLMLISGCAAYDGMASARDAGQVDAGSVSGDAAALADSGPSADGGIGLPDASAPDATFDGQLRGDAGPSREDLGQPSACYDFRDGDGDSLTDCEDDDCALAPVCCVGSSDPTCCTGTPDPFGADLRTCVGSGMLALAECEPLLTLFGAPRPELRDGAMVPLGTERYDSGIVLDRSVELRAARVEIEARIAPGGQCDGCLDALAIGLIPASQSPPGDAARIAPIAAIVVTESSGEARLVVSDAVIDTLALSELEARVGGTPGTAIVHRLVLSPSGILEWWASRDGATAASIATRRFPPMSLARIAAWGRSSNRGPGAPRPAALESITVRETTCDTPASLAREPDRVLPDGLDAFWDDIDSVRAPSVVSGGPGERLLFAIEDRVHLAEALGGGRFRAPADPGDPLNAVMLDARDPSLVDRGDHYELLFARPSDGTLQRAIGGAAHELVFAAPEVLITPSGQASTLDGPDHLGLTIDGRSRELLVARRALGDVTEIVLFDLDASWSGAAPASAIIQDPERQGGLSSESIHRNRAGDPTAFDSDEIAAPALVYYRGVLRLYYAGRRGTRWAIGMLVSEDAQHWSLANEGRPVLTGSRGGFDALSVRDPEPVVIDDELRLYHSASDGVTDSIALARHPMPAM